MTGQKTRTTYGQKNGQTGANYRQTTITLRNSHTSKHPQTHNLITDRLMNKSTDVSKTRQQVQVNYTEDITYTTYNMSLTVALNPTMHKAPSTYLVRHAKLLDHRCSNGSRLVEV